MEAPTNTCTIKSLLRHYAKWSAIHEFVMTTPSPGTEKLRKGLFPPLLPAIDRGQVARARAAADLPRLPAAHQLLEARQQLPVLGAGAAELAQLLAVQLVGLTLRRGHALQPRTTRRVLG